MAKFKAGDKVWCQFHRPDIFIMGRFPGVVLGESKAYAPMPSPFTFYDIEVPDLTLENQETCWHGQEIYLSPRHDPYDGDKAGDWESTPWKPEKVVV